MLIAEDVVVAAMGTSTKNQPGHIATQATELRNVVRRLLQGVFALTARVNPEFYGEREVVPFAAGGWARPADVELLWRIELPEGDEVIVVPSDDRKADTARPAVYRLGRTFYSAGNAADPIGGNLTFLFSSRPAVLAAITDPVDARFPDQFDGLLISDLAAYLARKDGRVDEAAAFREERDSWLKLYLAHVEHEVTNEVRRWAHGRTFHLPSLTPLLLGGAS